MGPYGASSTSSGRPPGWALITGGGRRLGRAIALGLAADGWHLALHHHRSAGAAEALARQIVDSGGTAVTLAADLADDAAAEALVGRAAAALDVDGRRYVRALLVNNAAIFVPDGADADAALWHAHMAVNLRAPHVLSRRFVDRVRTAGNGADGTIVNILDRSVVSPPTDFIAYTVAKAALWAATQIMARQAAPQVRVNAVGPGPTIVGERQSAAHFEALGAATPLRRNPAPEEIVDAVKFVVANRSLAGQMLLVDAGWHLL